MQQRILGRTGWRVSAISLGTEYLLDKPLAHVQGVIDRAIDRGINYFDLFYAHPGFRDTLGAALRPRRKDVLLTAHLGAVEIDGQGARSRDIALCQQFFADYLRRYHTDYVDVLFLHNCDEEDDYRELMGAPLELAQRLVRQGAARAIGFSGHTVATALQAVESGVVDVLMFPINLMGHAVPGRAGLFEAGVAHDVGLVAMKPFAGGRLLQPAARLSAEFWQRGGEEMQVERHVSITSAQCLSYVLAQPGVSTLVPGCADLAQLDDVLHYWEASDAERDYAEIVADFAQYTEGECVYCNHCLPCPAVIDIGQTIRLYDLAQGGLGESRRLALDAQYAAMPNRASDCIQCGACEARCPFGVAVIETMERATALFGA